MFGPEDQFFNRFAGLARLLPFMPVIAGDTRFQPVYVGDVSDAALAAVAVLAGLSLGTSRTPRDVMLRDASPPGEVGKVFGFVSAGLPLGSAITPVPLGLLIDFGHPHLVLPVVAGLLGLSLLCAGGAEGDARAGRRTRADAAVAPAE